MVPYVEEDQTASPVAVDIGNPSLRPTHSNNYDLLFEKFLHPLGMFQAGGFFKQLNADEVTITIPGSINPAATPGLEFCRQGCCPPSSNTRAMRSREDINAAERLRVRL